MKIAILGTRGIPNYYGGFEQCAERLSLLFTEYGHDVTVYSITDYDYKKRQAYYYAIEVVDKAGNKSPRFILNKQPIDASLGDSSGPAIAQLYDNTGGLNYKTGDTIKVTMIGEPDCRATFSLSMNSEEEISMQEVEPGVYKGEYTINATDTSLKTLIIGRLKYNDENIIFRILGIN